MPVYSITAKPDRGTGHIDTTGRLVFGGTTVAPMSRKNRFRLTNTHSTEPGVILYESDIPQFLAYLLARFQPFNNEIKREPDLPASAKNLAIAACLADRVFNDVSGWTSKYCVDCVGQRYRAHKTKEVMGTILGGDIANMLISNDRTRVECFAKAYDHADDIQDYVNKCRQEWRATSPNAK